MIVTSADWLRTITEALAVPVVAAAAAYARPVLPWWLGAGLCGIMFALGKAGAFRWDAADLHLELLQAAALAVVLVGAGRKLVRSRTVGPVATR